MRNRVNQLNANRREKIVRTRVFPAQLRPYARGVGLVGVMLAVVALAVMLLQWVVGCDFVAGCPSGMDLKWSSRIAISGLLLAYLGFLDE